MSTEPYKPSNTNISSNFVEEIFWKCLIVNCDEVEIFSSTPSLTRYEDGNCFFI